MTDLMVGSLGPREERYATKNEGLFIIVTNNKFDYEFTYKNPCTEDKSDQKHQQGRFKTEDFKVPAEEAIKNFKHIFPEAFKYDLLIEPDHLTKEEACSKDESAEDQKTQPFATFIKYLAKQMKLKGCLEEENRPSFLMFVLLSAGMNFGEFLLAGDEECKGCKGSKHRYTAGCNARKVSHLVKAIQEAESDENISLFSGIPKIFLVQTISGKYHPRVFIKSTKPPEKEIKPDDYIPRGSDTFVFYAHTDEACNWISKENIFYLLDKFCDRVGQLKSEIAEENAMLGELYQVLCDDEQNSDPATGEVRLEKINSRLKEMSSLIQTTGAQGVKSEPLQIQRESLCDGWFDNLCTTTAAEISQFLEEKWEVKARENRYKSGNYNHMRAHMSSTMRFRLSMIDILKH